MPAAAAQGDQQDDQQDDLHRTCAHGSLLCIVPVCSVPIAAIAAASLFVPIA
jgi:hypothetical protein